MDCGVVGTERNSTYRTNTNNNFSHFDRGLVGKVAVARNHLPKLFTQKQSVKEILIDRKSRGYTPAYTKNYFFLFTGRAAFTAVLPLLRGLAAIGILSPF
jgi:hypothetical protein